MSVTVERSTSITYRGSLAAICVTVEPKTVVRIRSFNLFYPLVNSRHFILVIYDVCLKCLVGGSVALWLLRSFPDRSTYSRFRTVFYPLVNSRYFILGNVCLKCLVGGALALWLVRPFLVPRVRVRALA